ncbi:ARM repeat-containing protein [Saccharata proteae CBS 121410]|uniref:ARM repeat-containing protein n=1 Tax=Saccharata proteae CBS 121410 TaxID=1314787 RepID=A0A9P4HNN5_9PEZI|nr:ARM repeat-containing protein [Saccharata proteae CBS 121410]
MTREASPPALEELSNLSATPTSQVTALKQLKNFIVGHDQRKELVVRRGIVPQLARVLQANAKSAGKRKSHQMNGGAAAAVSEEQSCEDEIRIQATLIVGSLAQGGPAFVAPLLAGQLLSPLLHAFSPRESPPKLVIATLRALITLCESSGDDLFLNPTKAKIADEIYKRPEGDGLSEILSQRPSSWNTQEQIGLVATLIAKSCRDDQHRNFLVKSGVLDLLSARLASYIARNLRDRGEVLGSDASAVAGLPSPPSDAIAIGIIQAISSIIKGSSYRTARFIYSPAIVAVIPKQLTVAERLLPAVAPAHNKESNFSKAFPALGSLSASGDATRVSSFAETHVQKKSRSGTDWEYEHVLFAWLMFTARREQAKNRLIIIELFTLLVDFAEANPLGHDLANDTQHRLFALLIVPMLVKMVEENADQLTKSTGQPDLQRSELLQMALKQLAALLEHSSILQKAASDANVTKKICQLLKKTFDVVPPSAQKRWVPATAETDEQAQASSSGRPDVLGKRGVAPEIAGVLKIREAALLALAAIAHKEDAHRKAIIESGAVACLADSLIMYEHPEDETSSSDEFDGEKVSNGAKDGNPVPVLIAACHTARAMSRSVSVLRTSMMDYGIAKPIYGLLKHPSHDVQLATTDVLINLLLQFCPMREVSLSSISITDKVQDLIEAGVLKKLCENAHSADSRMRMLSIWALKHLVLQVENELKVQCMEELGTGFLIQIVIGETRDTYTASRAHLHASRPETPIGMGTPNAAGEQVDLLNAVDEPAMDVENDSATFEDDDEDDVMADSIGLLGKRGHQNSLTAIHRARLRAIKEVETNAVLRAQKEDLRIQEQALEFIRNLIMADAGSSADDMIDHVLQTFSPDRFFEILATKLQPRPTASHNTAKTTSDDHHAHQHSSTAYLSPPEILLAATFVIVHIANGSPSHRRLVISQACLMTRLLPLFSHPDRRVRVACCWIINNLTFGDDEEDRPAARQRALELRNMGFEEAVRRAGKDQDLDVRERSRTGLDQFRRAVEGVGLGGVGGREGEGASGGGWGGGVGGSMGIGREWGR